MGKKALIYCRESLDNTEQIKAQRKICEDFCAENDIEVIKVIEATEQSGVKEDFFSRVSSGDVQELIDAKAIDCIVVSSVDRIDRTLNNIALTTKILKSTALS